MSAETSSGRLSAFYTVVSLLLFTINYVVRMCARMKFLFLHPSRIIELYFRRRFSLASFYNALHFFFNSGACLIFL